LGFTVAFLSGAELVTVSLSARNAPGISDS
jgi:hypothetical protein